MIPTTREELSNKLFALLKKYPAGARHGRQYCNELATALIEVTEEPLNDVPVLALDAVIDAANAYEVINMVTAVVSQAEKTHIRVSKGIEGDDLDGTYFLLYDDAGSVGFWIDTVGTTTTIPAGATAADRNVEITTIERTDDNEAIAAKLITAIDADGDFGAAAHADDDALVVTEAQVTVQALPGNAGDTGMYIARDQEGMTGGTSLHEKGFILYDLSGSVGVWFDVGGGGVEPAWATACTRQLEITGVTAAMTAAEVAGIMRTAIGGEAEYGAAGSTNNCNVTLAAYGSMPLAEDVDAGFAITRGTEGSSTGSASTDILGRRLLLIEAKINDIIAAQSV